MRGRWARLLVAPALVAGLSGCQAILGPSSPDGNWQLCDRGHFTFYVRPGSFCEQNIGDFSRMYNPFVPDAARASVQAPPDQTEIAFHEARVAHWERIAANAPQSSVWARTYHRRLQRVYQSLVLPGQRVLELGCGTGDLLASLEPAVGVGVDFAPTMVATARARHPNLRVIGSDVHDLDLQGTFDFIVLSDLVNDLWDVQRVFAHARRWLAPGGRVVLNFYSRVWELPLKMTGALGLSTRLLEQNWLTPHDVQNLLTLARCDMVRHWTEVLCPVPVPVLEPFCNRVLVRSWPFSLAALTNVVVARGLFDEGAIKPRSVSVVVPARNEAGHIDALFARMPDLGTGAEWIFVEGHSTDDSRERITGAIGRHTERRCLLLEQEGTGKGDAVRLGFAHATGDVLMILDADLTMPPEQLPRFYDALVSGKGDFVNGVRLVYPMEAHAMRFFNLVANKFFGWLFSWLLGQHIRDTLCGTKALWKRDYDRIAASRTHFGDFDPFGDFELLFGAAKLNCRIVEVPVRYRQRVYGETSIRRWHDGWLLLRMAMVAARRLKWT